MIKAVGMNSSGAPKQFTGTDFTGALFRDVDLTDATITGLIDGLTVNEIEVAPLVAGRSWSRTIGHPRARSLGDEVGCPP